MYKQQPVWAGETVNLKGVKWPFRGVGLTSDVNCQPEELSGLPPRC